MSKNASVDWPTVARFLAGGSLLGAGAGAATSGARWLQALRDEAARNDNTSRDDNTLYLNLGPEPKPKQMPVKGKRPVMPAEKMASTDDNSGTAATFATGGLASILGAYLSYNAVRGHMQAVRRQQLQKQLNDAQQVYLGGLTNAKAAAFSTLTKGVGTGYLTLALSALGSAVVANKLLEKQFPAVQSPFRDRPRKIVIRSSPEEPAEDVVEPPGGVTPDAVEGLMRTHMGDKAASTRSGFVDLVAAVADGRSEEIKHVLETAGLDAMFDVVKGAALTKQATWRTEMATSWICADPLMRTALEPVLAAEFSDQAPGLFKLASHIPQNYLPGLIGLVGAGACEVRKNFFSGICKRANIKQAEFEPEGEGGLFGGLVLAKALQSALSAKDPSERPAEHPEMKMNENVPASRDSDKVSVEAKDDPADAFFHQHGHDLTVALKRVA